MRNLSILFQSISYFIYWKNHVSSNRRNWRIKFWESFVFQFKKQHELYS